MVTMKDYECFVRIGAQSNRLTAASVFREWDMNLDGFGLGTTKNVVDIPTKHRVQGLKHQLATSRNFDSQQLSGPVFPNVAGDIFNGVVVQNGELPYYTMELWWDSTLANPCGGRTFYGVIFDSLTININRGGQGEGVIAEIGAYQNSNEERAVVDVPATYTGSPELPYASTDALIDLVLNGTTADFSGDNVDVLSMTFTYQNNTVVKKPLSNPIARLDKTWTTQTPQIPTVQIDATLEMTDCAYIAAHDAAGTTKGAARFVLRHPDASCQETSTSTVSAGSTSGDQTITVADTSNLVAGDAIVMTDPDVGFAVHIVDTVASGTDFTINTDESAGGFRTYVALDGSSGDPIEIENMAVWVTIFSLTLTSPLTLPAQEGDRVVNVTMTGAVEAGQTAIARIGAYNHDTATHP